MKVVPLISFLLLLPLCSSGFDGKKRLNRYRKVDETVMQHRKPTIVDAHLDYNDPGANPAHDPTKPGPMMVEPELDYNDPGANPAHDPTKPGYPGRGRHHPPPMTAEGTPDYNDPGTNPGHDLTKPGYPGRGRHHPPLSEHLVNA